MQTSFAANPAKSATLTSKWLCDKRTVLKVDRNNIPGIGVNDTYRYLNVDVGVDLEGSSPPENVNNLLKETNKSTTQATTKDVYAWELPTHKGIPSISYASTKRKNLEITRLPRDYIHILKCSERRFRDSFATVLDTASEASKALQTNGLGGPIGSTSLQFRRMIL